MGTASEWRRVIKGIIAGLLYGVLLAFLSFMGSAPVVGNRRSIGYGSRSPCSAGGGTVGALCIGHLTRDGVSHVVGA
jgi:hypothetical protein